MRVSHSNRGISYDVEDNVADILVIVGLFEVLLPRLNEQGWESRTEALASGISTFGCRNRKGVSHVSLSDARD